MNPTYAHAYYLQTADIDLEEEEPDFVDIELQGATNRVMRVMKDLYATGFDVEPATGVLAKEGLLYVKGGISKLQGDRAIQDIYNLINECTGNYLVQSEVMTKEKQEKLRDMTYRQGTTYYPEYVLGNAMGITPKGKVYSWHEAELSLKREVTAILGREREKGRDLNDIVDALTTGIVISEYNPKSCIAFRIAIAGNKLNPDIFRNAYTNRQRQLLGGSSSLGRCERLDSGVVEIEIIMDSDIYFNAPLFAYQAIEGLKRNHKEPSVHNTILGRDQSRKTLTENLTAQKDAIILICAGPRSGKGVLTLNILGSILGSGCPFVYWDCKPDMSVTIRELAQKAGAPIPAVWDAKLSFNQQLGVGAPKEAHEFLGDLFGPLAYLKGVQLMVLLAQLAAEKKFKLDKPPFFIFDEVQALQGTLQAAWTQMSQEGNKKETDDDSEYTKWCRKVMNWGNMVQSNLESARVSQLPMSGVKTVWLFQDISPEKWNSLEAKSGKSKFNPFAKITDSNTMVKLLGNGQERTTKGTYNLKNNSDVINKIRNRWFAMTTSQNVDADSVKLFMPYLVLNTANNGDDCVEEFRKNVGEDLWRKLAPEGHLHPGAGLEGYVNMIGEGAISNISSGRALLQQLMDYTGLSSKYSSIDEYLYDASIDSFYTISALKEGNIGGTVAGDDDGISMTGDFDEYDSGELNKPGQRIHMDFPQSGGTTHMGGGTAYEVPLTPPVTDDTFDPSDYEQPPINPQRPPVTPQRPTAQTGQFTKKDLDDIGITPEQLAQVLNRIGYVQPQSAVNSQGYTVTNAPDERVTYHTPENAVDCTRTARVKLGWAQRIAMNTPSGANIYLESLFKNLLSEASRGFSHPSMITRFAIIGDQMFINGKELYTNGILGGQNNLRASDIFDARVLFKKFKNLRDLELDVNTLSNTMMEFGTANPQGIFNGSKSLQRITIHSNKGPEVITRNSTYMGRNSRDAKDKADASAAFSQYSNRTFNGRWQQNTRGKEVWGRNTMKRGLNYAGNAYGGDKIKPFRGAAAAIGGAAIGVVGAVSWFGFNMFRSITGIWSNSGS